MEPTPGGPGRWLFLKIMAGSAAAALDAVVPAATARPHAGSNHLVWSCGGLAAAWRRFACPPQDAIRFGRKP